MIPVNQPLLDGNEGTYLQECISSGWISSEGSFVERFEAGMAALTGRKHAIAVCNGTAALECAVAALGLEVGDQVAMPTFTIISCAAAVLKNSCIPLFVDSDPATWNIDINKLGDLLKDEIENKGNLKLKAIMVVHIYGLPVDMDPVLELAERYGLKIIEDAAEMHGQTYRGRPCGSFGDVSTFSFYPNKHITCGEGGMLVTDDDILAERCRSLRNLCFQTQKRFVHEELGYNFRMTNMQAAIGVAQLERLDEFVMRKRRMGNLYTELLADCEGIELPLASTEYAENIYWVYGIILKDELDIDAEAMMKRLGEFGIGTRPFFWPMHEQPVLMRMGLDSEKAYPVAERLARRGFYIPSGMALESEQIENVASIVRKAVEERRMRDER
ncbi:MAG: DegT/DnrJ/EryC1/StrS family aminotransferase [Desulfuromonadaceae bacterium]|nr:DegT/DnrJ/EryC1/StrS family aminotransferase [Desulfuromonadaceae bacterium]MDD2856483.1 DegT/DnrJ/EryC1/StrS family aminotransferase [Desulfuromonadaceae bacterium]